MTIIEKKKQSYNHYLMVFRLFSLVSGETPFKHNLICSPIVHNRSKVEVGEVIQIFAYGASSIISLQDP